MKAATGFASAIIVAVGWWCGTRLDATLPEGSAAAVTEGQESQDAAGGSESRPRVLEATILLADAEDLVDRDSEQALKLCDKAHGLHPTSATIRWRRAYLRARLGRFDGAAQDYLAVGPRYPAARELAAHCAALAGDYPAAARLFEEFLASWPCVGPFPYCAPSGFNEEPQSAAAHWGEVCKSARPSAVTWWLLGNAKAVLGDLETAKAAFVKAAGLEPGWLPARLHLAVLEESTDAQLRALGEVIAASPHHASARTRRSALLANRGDYAGAAENLDVVVRQLKSGDHHGQLELGILVEQANNLERCGQQKDAGELLDLAALDLADDVTGLLVCCDANQFAEPSTSAESKARRGHLWRLRLIASASGAIDNLVRAAANGATAETLGKALDEWSIAMSPTSDDVAKGKRIAERIPTNMPRRVKDILDGRNGTPKDRLGAIVACVMRCVDDLVRDAPGVDSARVLRVLVRLRHGALLGKEDGEGTCRVALLDVLKRRPQATAIRIAVCDARAKLGLDALACSELLSAVPASHRAQPRVQLRQAIVDCELGRHAACERLCFYLIHEVGGFANLYELLGRSLRRKGANEPALRCLEYAASRTATAGGLLEMAALRLTLQRPRATEALIDAWRAAAPNSSEERQASELLKQQPALRDYVCGNCGGDGLISRTAGGIYVSTYDARCSQCKGLGLWFPGTRD